MDLDQFQKTLKADESVKAAFAKDPVATLRRHGIRLPEEAERQLAAGVRRQASGKTGAEVLVNLTIKF